MRLPHFCHAEGCETTVPPRMFMCLRHWRMVPKHLQDRLWDVYVPGQETRKDPTPAYIEVAHLLIEHVAEDEGRR